MRIVMPLFDFINEDSQEFVFGDGRYALRRFDANDEIPKVPGLSEVDISYIKRGSWALVAENSDLKRYKEEINFLLLSFKIYTSARLFIKYRLCKEDTNLCSKIVETMQFISPKKSKRQITRDDLSIVNKGFSNLIKMDAVSNRTHNALYCLYRGFFTTHALDSFMFLMMALEALFSKEERGGATKTICSRVSKFLDSEERCKYEDIDALYGIRSKIAHGKIRLMYDPEFEIEKLIDLEYVVKECMKKILNNEIYLRYVSTEEKEDFYNELEEKWKKV